MNIGTEYHHRLAKLSASLKRIRKELPGTKIFPVSLKREVAALLNLGVDAEKIAEECGFRKLTITRWGNCHSAGREIVASRALQVVPDRRLSVLARIEQPQLICEIDIGCSVVIKFPVDGLTQGMLRNLREAFHPC